MKLSKNELMKYKSVHRKITMVTGYDFPCASIADECGIDAVLVGDSVGTNVLGYTETSQVTMEDMLHHVRAVARGVKRAFILADLPAEAIVSPEDSLYNAKKILENGADGVKIEGGVEIAGHIALMTQYNFPVCGHIGYTPQKMGNKAVVQGRDLIQAQKLIESALALEKAGAFMIVLELVTRELAGEISGMLAIPTIGIGAGSLCDGQVQVINDIAGLSPRTSSMHMHSGTFVENIHKRFRNIVKEVSEGVFPIREKRLRA